MAKKYMRCPECKEKYKTYSGLSDHILKEHPDDIPKGFTVSRYMYYKRTGKTHGNCVECGKPTEWKESTGKYARYCSDACLDRYREKFKQRMIAKHGVVHMLNDPEHQREMLQNRSISGVYTWSDGAKKNYTGSYELDCLKFLDVIMNFESDDVLSSSPHTYYYDYEGKRHFYIPDIFIASLGLEIEVKDGGDNPNTHHKIQAVDKVKEKLKDAVMESQTDFDYIKIVNKEYTNFLEYLYNRKSEVLEENNKKMKEDVNITSKSNPTKPKPVTESEKITVNDVPDMLNQVDHPDGFYSSDGIWNAVVWVDGRPYRDCVETIIVRNNSEIFLDINSDYYRIPGGSKEKDADDLQQAKNECEEEAHIIVDDMVKTNFVRTSYFDKKTNKINKNDRYSVIQNLYYGKKADIYVGKFVGYSNRKIDIRDRDFKMEKNGKFYKIDDVWDRLEPEHKSALVSCGFSPSKGIITESTKYLPDNMKDYVFVCLANNKSFISDSIKRVTGAEYSHSALSFDLTMNDMYSYGGVPLQNVQFNGFVKESIYSPTYSDNVFFSIYAFPVKKENMVKMKKELDKMLYQPKKYLYDTIEMLKCAFKPTASVVIGMEERTSYFCSEFVAAMLSLSQGKDYNKYTAPGDIEKFDEAIRIGTYTIDTYTEEQGIKDFKEVIKDRKRMAKALEESFFPDLGEAVYRVIGWDDPVLRAYTGFLDWKMIKDRFESIFGIKDKKIRWGVTEFIIKGIILPFDRTNGKQIRYKDYTKEIIQYMNKIKYELDKFSLIINSVSPTEIRAVDKRNVIKKLHVLINQTKAELKIY